MKSLLVILGILILVVIVIVNRKNKIDHEDVDRKFKASRKLHIALYFLEMWFFFVLFNVVIGFEWFKYDEDLYFKRFTDFFLIYQILVLVLLKMINSLKIDALLINRLTAELCLASIENNTYKSSKKRLFIRLDLCTDPSKFTTTKEAMAVARSLRMIVTYYDRGLLTKDEALTHLNSLLSEVNFNMDLLTFHWLDSFFLNMFK